ncbi:hypothetical protein PHYSODRAFT_327641 [Phytophthora sojae]|uniref:RxLR effector protein n=1 Tax=Phytophthora sojae (strain P6497) TaxID=1094619 RepID=G4Z3J6_PHYSP|nr:hypothetical protein PHYSODRAFT_327641 [Phytophthora sojae]EGZ19368.1 hypothetical protein PHYSODRAFT_327641 [Phytophthora sojae]|eukprot:XP_009522085.1 hypothetical protein PHYSODRAFT_327641 [Phytophthora sojae]
MQCRLKARVGGICGVTRRQDEDRAFDFKKRLDYKKLLGFRDVPKDFANGVLSAYSKATLKEMVKNHQFRDVMFKQWDKIKLDRLVQIIGPKTLKNKRIAEMFVGYRYNHRIYKWPVSR